MSKYLREELQGLGAYVPGEQPDSGKYIKLNTNESPFPPGEKVLAAIDRGRLEDLRLYPDPEQILLREALAKNTNERSGNGLDLDRDNIFVSNGSDDIINFAFMAFGDRRKCVVYPDISYGFYKVFADFQGIPKREIPLKDDFAIDPKEYCDIEYDGMPPGIIVIANPNAPTGIALDLKQIEEIALTNPKSVVLIDEAYVDFGGESAAKLIPLYDNLLVSRTFSKSASLAGARLGFAIGQKSLIEDLNLIRCATNPYNVNRMTEAVGLAVLEESEYYINNCRTVAEIRDDVQTEVSKLGFYVTASLGNFIFVGAGKWATKGSKAAKISGEGLYKKLREKNILVRWFDKERIKDFLRVSVGSRDDMTAFVNAIRDILDEL